jgi:hypothetical protein
MFKLQASERLTRWREFRKSLDNLPLEEALVAVADFWASCPFSPYYLDPGKPDEWPDPWTMITENYYCDIAKALGMLYTIKYTKHDPEVELRMYFDPETKYGYNLVWIEQGKYVINLVTDEIVNKAQVENTLKLKAIVGSQLHLNR